MRKQTLTRSSKDLDCPLIISQYNQDKAFDLTELLVHELNSKVVIETKYLLHYVITLTY